MKQVIVGMILGAVLAYGAGFVKGYHDALASPFHTATQRIANVEKHFEKISVAVDNVGADIHKAVDFVTEHMPHIPHLEDGNHEKASDDLFSDDVPVAPGYER